MLKNKIILIISIIFMFTINACYAVDINMNLSDNFSSEQTMQQTQTTGENTADEPLSTQQILESATVAANKQNQNEQTEDSSIIDAISTKATESIKENDFLSLTNILNIILISIGIVLILLAVAILSRL